jgi:hypothetical protein
LPTNNHSRFPTFYSIVSAAGPSAAAAVYEFAIDRFPDFALLRVSLAVELIKAGQSSQAKHRNCI